MELLEAFYRRKLRRKQRKPEPGQSDVAVAGRTPRALARTPSEASVSGLATGLISKVLRFTSRYKYVFCGHESICGAETTQQSYSLSAVTMETGVFLYAVSSVKVQFVLNI